MPKRLTKIFVFLSLISFSMTVYAPGDSIPPEAIGIFAIPVLIHNITEQVAKLQATIQLLTMAPTPRDMVGEDGAMRDGPVADESVDRPKVVKLSEVSGNDSRDGSLPAALLPLQINAVIEGRIKQLDDLTKQRLKEVIDGTKPIIDLAADLKMYGARAIKLIGVSAGLYIGYRLYSSWLRQKKSRTAAIMKCFALSKKQRTLLFSPEKSKKIVVRNKKITAMSKRFDHINGGLFVLKGSAELSQEALTDLAKLRTLGFVPAHVIKQSFTDVILQKNVIAAMKALEKENIPLIVLNADALLTDAPLLHWIQLSFKPNKIVFVSSEDGVEKMSAPIRKIFARVI